MNVLFITAHYPPIIQFGAAMSSKLICENLKKRGHQVDIFVHDKAKRKEEYEKHGLEELYKGSEVCFFSEEGPYSDIDDGDYDVIHQYGGKNKGRVAFKFRNFTESKVVTTLNGPTPPLICEGRRYDPKSIFCCSLPKDAYCSAKADFWGNRDYKYNPVKASRDYIKYKFDKHVQRYYDRLFPQSEWLKRLFEKSGVPSEKLKVIPNFYDPNFYERLRDTEKDLSGTREEKIQILYVGRMKESKGVMNLLKAYERISVEKETELVLVGSGDLENEIRRFIYGNDMEQVRFVGFVPYEEVHKYYIESDIFVHPCKYPTEAFNRTLTEAGLGKNAMIVSDAGTSPEIVGEDGLIYESGDVDGLKEKMETLVEDESLLEELKERLNKKIKDKYSIERVVGMIEEEYLDLVE